MVLRAAWYFAAVFLAAQCGVALCAGVATGDDVSRGQYGFLGEEGDQPTGKAPSGDFPTQELKEKSNDIERQYLAKQKVVADHKEEKWQKKVLKVKVSRYADYLQEKKKKDMDKERESNFKITKVRAKEHTSKGVSTANRQRSDDLDVKMAYGDERQKKADFALKEAIKQVTRLKNGEGMNAVADRQTAAAMLAKLRVAQAHADNSVMGLTKAQKKDLSIQMLHNSIQLAVGSPTDTNIALAFKQIKDSTHESTRESYEKIQQMNDKNENDQKAFQKKLDDAEKLKKHNIEVAAKKTSEKDGKRDEHVSEGLELPVKRLKESYDKKAAHEQRTKWHAHESRIVDEIAIKSQLKTQKMMTEEADFKKTKAAKEKTLKEECAILEKKKMGVLEGRNKAVAAFNKARENLIVAQGAMNNVKPYDPSQEEPAYVNKGPECVVIAKHILSTVAANSAEQCQTACNEKKTYCNAVNYPVEGKCQLLKPGAVGDHPPCVTQSNGECKQVPAKPKDCSVYQKISGPGSDSERKSRELLGFIPNPLAFLAESASSEDEDHAQAGYGNPFARRRRSPSTPAPTPDMEKAGKHAAGVARAQEVSTKQKEHEKNMKEQEQKQVKEEERQRKLDEKNKIAQEGASKQAKIAESLALEKQKKQGLAEAERKAHNAQAKMQESNSKAADADTQSRHCEGEMYRRRRTCACDDMGGVANAVSGGRRLLQMSVTDQEIATKKMQNWERRRYVRRRYVVPTAADRRRRYQFPAPPPPARLPGAVCPCCTPAPDGTPDPSPACVAARKKAKEHQRVMNGGG